METLLEVNLRISEESVPVPAAVVVMLRGDVVVEVESYWGVVMEYVERRRLVEVVVVWAVMRAVELVED
ncbi:hypothetical protein ACLOJK_005199 [Asimina triloba]